MVAQKQLGLTDEQMRGMDVHHNPPVSEGGRNIPEHLFVYHPTLHAAIHGGYTEYAREGARRGWERRQELGMGKGYRTGGGPPKKTQPSSRDILVAKLRHLGFSRKEIAEQLDITETMVKRSVMEAKKFGIVFDTKPGPKAGLPQKGGVPKGTNQPNQYTK